MTAVERPDYSAHPSAGLNSADLWRVDPLRAALFSFLFVLVEDMRYQPEDINRELCDMLKLEPRRKRRTARAARATAQKAT